MVLSKQLIQLETFRGLLPSARRGSVAGAALLFAGVLASGGEVSAQETLGTPYDAPCPAAGPIVEGFSGAMAHVRYLADDALEGRGVASWGERCSAEYIVAKLEEYGVQPGSADGSFYHVWEARLGSVLGETNTFAVEDQSFELGTDWLPLGFSQSTSLVGTLAVPPSLGDQAGASPHGSAAMSLEGRVIVVDASGPANPHAPAPDPHQIASSAAQMGAGGVVVVVASTADLPNLSQERRAALSVPVVAVTGPAAEAVLQGAESGDGVAMEIDVAVSRGDALNVVGVIRGQGPTADEVVVIGAHYDHLGFGGQGSLSPNDFGIVHNGADDNASGTAVLLELARSFASGPAPSRTLVFVAFTGEERGLWGSAKYVEEPAEDLSRPVAMINMDMVGRLVDGKLTVMGTATAEEWPDLLTGANHMVETPLDLALVGDGFGASDHSSFYAKGIPVLHFFTNTHPQYHRVEDDWDLINAEGLAQVGAVIGGVVSGLAGAHEVVALTPVEGQGNPRGGSSSSSMGGGFKVRLGTIPDYSQEEGGMRITGVRDGSPAAKGGLQGGDVIIKFGDREIEDVYGYMYALGEAEPGDEVDIVVLRDGQEVTVTVVLEAAN